MSRSSANKLLKKNSKFNFLSKLRAKKDKDVLAIEETDAENPYINNEKDKI